MLNTSLLSQGTLTIVLCPERTLDSQETKEERLREVKKGALDV